MLFHLSTLLGIKAGKVTLAFRKWERPNVKKGGTMKTAVGVIGIDDVALVSIGSIAERDAKQAGFDDVASLKESLDKVEKGKVYKVKVSYRSEDPRIKLRENTALSGEDFQKLMKRLERLDKAKRSGPWTMSVLKLIQKHPRRRAGDLATMIGRERLDFKLDVRKLKNLGLTISHEVGYSISKLGEMVLKRVP